MEEFEGKLIELNNRFYKALEEGDITIMEEVWLTDENAKCVHPGWPLLKGWSEIKESWERIFDSGELSDVKISDTFVEISENAAMINCVEKLSHYIGGQTVITMAQTTNIFEMIDSRWYMVLHHASPIPVPSAENYSDTLQ